MSHSNQFFFLLLTTAAITVSSYSLADTTHYRDILIGGRASTMGGAYTAVSDDAAGLIYNPAGMAMAPSDSISGSAKIFHNAETTYKETIGVENWERTSSNFLANFFGVIKKLGNHTLAISYAIPDAAVEHQDQTYYDPTQSISDYTMNLHTEDVTDLISLGHSMPIFPGMIVGNLTYGISLGYLHRSYISTFHQQVEYNNNTDYMGYSTTTTKENGINGKLGLLWQYGQFAVGVTAANTVLINSSTIVQTDTEQTGATNNIFLKGTSTVKREFPYEFKVGFAFFQSTTTLFACDFEYYISNNPSNVDTWNLSFGTEHYLNQSNSLRLGLYTNNSNQLSPEEGITESLTHIDMYGATVGYTNYSKESSVTLGLIYSMGAGETQPYDTGGLIRDIEKTSISVVMSADYGF
ncbi:MAG: hypothetical protein A2504_09700 [Bdellovibrionales bacterium RIFOXYD12_FULL_39_22]|nr:MAG: hypothetical protein A2385_13190 [Bdellovibrionales bacterium RIFOXYB1_FULL_39_21]OFZ41001.1 MAG: hypothetical protein A2485_16700 [Bdellovibrionales bacterium RIFOXYC12_FULL_39_17]OFZ44829.1 MAG: hypothetical protein A2404_09990 [Bdellovibrionales bacterium RIFOXYC1_FULL_39_130]OFZ74294.1 MAG: hypothetical protein A2560_16955 [Bdellovibrionales bacterium RIFOXYD1_FULL_39_84]OFZ92158.1 MAG: hypothetical protein A2504_09700 [Bdellovibrionales bacterium RIFOXYD12_FULL_39_22]HLE12738.1 hy